MNKIAKAVLFEEPLLGVYRPTKENWLYLSVNKLPASVSQNDVQTIFSKTGTLTNFQLHVMVSALIRAKKQNAKGNITTTNA